MAINQETRINKSNTFEDWRQKDNEISIHLGDTALLDSKITDKEYSTTASAGDYIFTGTRFELSTENTIDNISGAIILKSGPTMTSFVANATVFQGSDLANATWSATITSVISNTKIYVKGASGTFNAASAIKASSATIAAGNVSRLITESYPTGVIRVYSDGTELPQTLTAGGFHVANYQGYITLASNPSIPASFTEGCSLYQGSALASATWSGTLHSVVGTATLRLKTSTGSFDAGEILKVDGNTGASNQIAHANLTSLTAVDYSYGSLIELHTVASASDVIKIDASSLVYAVNEVQDDIGDIASFGTTAKTDVVTAVNELETAIRGSTGNYTLSTAATDIIAGVNEIHDDVGTLTSLGTTQKGTIVGSINELETAVRGSTANYTLGTAATDIVGAINEIETAVRGASSNYTLTTGSGNLVGAINEHETQINSNDTDIGNLMTLIDGASTVDSSISFSGLSGGNIKAAIDELSSEKVDLVSSSSQTINSDLAYTSGKTFTFPTGSTLDVSAGTLIIGGGAGSTLSFETAFLTLTSSATAEGMRIDRSEISGASVNPTVDSQIYWDESQVGTGANNTSHRGWRVKGLTNPDSGTPATSTADIVTFYNAKDLVASNTESGIAVTWDATNQNFDFNVNDPTLTIAGDVDGNATMTNLGNTTITVALDASGVTAATYGSATNIPVLAVDAKGRVTSASNQAVATALTVDGDSGAQNVSLLSDDLQIIGTTNEIETAVTKVGTDVKVTVGLPTNVTIAGNLTVSGTQTTVNSNTVNIGDNMIVLNSDETGTPSQDSGFEVERGSSTNAKFYWDESTDRFVVNEADGVERQITRAGDTIFTITGDSGGSEAVTVGYGTLDIAGGANIDTVWNSGTNTLTINNSSVDANGIGIIDIVATDSGYSWGSANVVTDQSNDTITLVEGVGIDLASDASNDAIRISHQDTSSQASVNNSNGTVIQDITLDTNGHITGLASYDLDNRYSSNAVETSGNQTIAGTKTFSSTISGSINGNAATATAIYLTADNTATNNSYPIPIASAGGSANRTLFEDDNLTYNPATNTLYTTTFSGALSGNASTASQVYVNAYNASANLRLAFTDAADTSTNTSLYRDGGGNIYYNPSTNTLHGVNINATTFSGALTGTASNATTAGGLVVETARNDNANRIVRTDAAGYLQVGWINTTSGDMSTTAIDRIYCSNDSYIRYKSIANFRTAIDVPTKGGSGASGNWGINVTGSSASTTGASTSCSGNSASASTVYVAGAGGNASYRMVFGETNDGSSANESLYKDSGFNFYYNPSSNTLTTGTFSGALSGNASTATWADTVDVNDSNSAADYRVVWHSGDTVYSTAGVTIHAGNNYVNATDFIASSDDRLKNRVGTLDNALDKVCAIDGFLYTWNDQAKSEDKETVQIGVSAQQVQEVLPEAVSEGTDGYLGVKYDKLVPLLIESIKELKSEVEELKRINSTE